MVVIEPGGPNAERASGLAPDPGLRGNIRERAIAVVVVKRVSSSARDEYVLVPVVIEITDRDAEVVSEILAQEPGFASDVLECAIALVTKQAIVKRRASLL